MSQKTKTAIKAIAGFILAVALIFMVVSLSLASAHDRPLVDEWKSWVQEEEVQETPEDNTTEDQETPEDNTTEDQETPEDNTTEDQETPEDNATEDQETPEDNTTEGQETDDIVDGELSGQGDLTDME